MFEHVFKNIDDIQLTDAGCRSELDYVEQSSWALFLKSLADLEKDLAEFIKLQKQSESENSWTVNIKAIDQNSFDLSVKNPNIPEEKPMRKPKERLKDMADLDKERVDILNSISEMI